MAVFAVIQPHTQAPLENTLAEYPQRLKVREGVWLIAAEGTAQDVSNQLGVTDGKAGSAIILKVSSYYGRTDPSTWDWISANWE